MVKKDKGYNSTGTSGTDPGVAETQARVAEQLAPKPEPKAVKPDAHHQGILDRVKAAQKLAAKANAERDKAAGTS